MIVQTVSNEDDQKYLCNCENRFNYALKKADNHAKLFAKIGEKRF